MKLIIEDDEGRRTVVPIIRDELFIGRADTNTVRLSEKNVSRKHARLLRQEGRFFIEDLASFTGVRVNGEKVQGKASVTAGDLIQISEYDLFLQPAPGEPLPPGEEPLVDEDVIVTGPIKPADAAESERDKPTSVIKMENVAGAGQATARDLGPEEQPRLVVLEGALRGKEFVLDRSPIAIGRTPENDVALEDTSVSRFHCKLFLEGDTWKLLDNRSALGVRINGEAYATCRVRPGDVVEIGKVKLRFLAHGQALPAGDLPGAPATASIAATAITAAAAAGAPPAASASSAAAPQAGSSRKLVVLGAAAAAAIALAVVMVQRSRVAPAPVAAAPAEDDAVQAVAVQADVIHSELAKAADAMAQHKFGDALQHFELAQKAGASAQELKPARVASAELRDEQALKKLDAAVASQHWDDAKALLDALPSAPGYFADQMRARAAAVRKGYVDDHLARADAMRAQSPETCVEEARLALAADASSATARSLIDECKKPRAPAVASLDRTAAPSEPAKVESVQRTDASPAARPEVRAEARTPEPQRPAQVTPVPPAPPPSPADASPTDVDAQAKKLVGEGNQKLLAEDFDSAVGLFQKALSLQPSQPILATLYRSMGIALTRQGNIEEGAHYYRLYLPLCTNDKERQYLQKTLEEYEARRR